MAFPLKKGRVVRCIFCEKQKDAATTAYAKGSLQFDQKIKVRKTIT